MRTGYITPRQYRWFTHYLQDAAGRTFTVQSFTSDRLAAIGMCVRRYPHSEGFTLVATR